MDLKKRLNFLQIILLLSGTLFAWNNVFKILTSYRIAGGRIFQFTNCPETNPLITPCFWGATAFLFAFVWSLVILNSNPKKQLVHQIKLKWFLVASTIFGWGNVALDFYKYYAAKMQPIESCTGLIKHPIYAPCFFGSIIFLASLLTTVWVVIKNDSDMHSRSEK